MRSASEVLKARGVNRLVYFHSDHFEPWRHVPGRPLDYAYSVEDVRRYVRKTQKRDWARCATLFYKATINFMPDAEQALWRADPADVIGFRPATRFADRISTQMLDALTSHGREIQIHIHHENVTWNDRMHDERIREHLATPENRRFDEARFELMLQLNLDLLERHAKFDRTRWFFVHGHWALNASDPHECTLVREIEILRRNGCLGDFTQPSGRPHTDSRLEEPYLVRPVPLAKGYDRPEADPIAAAGAGSVPADRFLVWASQINHRFTSIDHYSRFVRERMEDPEVFARTNAEQGFVHDGTLYVKTHAHSMQPVYWENDGGGPFPHAHPGIIRELGTLFDAASAAGVAVEFATVSQVFDRLMAAPKAPARDLVDLYTLREGNPMAEIGCEVVFQDRNGPAALPPLADPHPGLPRPAAALPAETPSDAVWATIEEHLPPANDDQPPLQVIADPELAACHDRLLPIAAAHGVTDLSAAIAMVGVVEAASGRSAPIVEIGSDDDSLSVLLGMRGHPVTAIDDRAQSEVARAIAAEADARGLLVAIPRFEEASLGHWRTHASDGTATAVVRGFTSREGLSGQASFIRRLGNFAAVIVDLSHFFVVRNTPGEHARLLELFARAGFAPPRRLETGNPDQHLVLFSQPANRRGRGWAGWMLRSLLGRKAA